MCLILPLIVILLESEGGRCSGGSLEDGDILNKLTGSVMPFLVSLTGPNDLKCSQCNTLEGQEFSAQLALLKAAEGRCWLSE